MAALHDRGSPKAGNFAAVHMTAIGPLRRFAAVQRDVGNRGQTGPSTDEAQTAVLDQS
jgi:hypothetical protein